MADDAIRAIDDVPITNVTHIDKVSLSDTGISAADVKNSSIKNANIENGGIKKVNIKNTSIEEGLESQLDDIGEGSVKVSKLAAEKTPAEIVEVTTNNTPKIVRENLN